MEIVILMSRPLYVCTYAPQHIHTVLSITATRKNDLGY